MAKVTTGQTLQHLFCKMLQKGACDITSKEVSFEGEPQTAGFFSRTQKLGHPSGSLIDPGSENVGPTTSG